MYFGKLPLFIGCFLRESDGTIYTPLLSTTASRRVCISLIYIGYSGINSDLAVKNHGTRWPRSILGVSRMIEFPKWGYGIFGRRKRVERVGSQTRGDCIKKRGAIHSARRGYLFLEEV